MQTHRADVVIVGLGPTGKVLGAALGLAGLSVVAVERQTATFPLPRAVNLDRMAFEILQRLGLGSTLEEHTAPAADYRIVDADEREILRIPMRLADGRPRAWSVYQPAIEDALDEVLGRLSSVRVIRGWTASEGDAHDGAVLLENGPARALLTGDVVVACDGARSLLRSQARIDMIAEPFDARWLACDLRPEPPARVEPRNDQMAGTQARVAATAGPRHLRWEFLLEPGDRVPDVHDVWRRLNDVGVTARTATLVRHASYTVGAAMAERWSHHRFALAGDAAHVMPPFAGQGMCSGIKDAAALAVLLARATRSDRDHPSALLSRYEEQRRPEAARMLRTSVELGEMVCGAAAAAHR